MKVLVISDTHGYIGNVITIIDMLIPIGLDRIIHCGDLKSDVVKLQALYPKMKFYSIPGNCDGAYGEETGKCIEIDGVSIYITHGHRYNVKAQIYDELVIDTIAHEAKVAIFGHTHCALLKKEGDILLMNPGSISLPRDFSTPSYGILDINKGIVKNATILQIIDKTRVCTHPATHFIH